MFHKLQTQNLGEVPKKIPLVRRSPAVTPK